MGGQAFASHASLLPTPRMLPAVYDSVLKETLHALRGHYAQVESPIEAPGKTTFGDVDVLVTGALEKDFDPEKRPWSEVADRLGEVMGAVSSIKHNGKSEVNLAVPWPQNVLPSVEHSPEPAELEEVKYVQIDIHHLHSSERFQWELFHSAHGDLWSILGSIIRQFGLTVNDRGLYLRIPDIELLDRKKSMIFLTEKPSEVLNFIGLDEKAWWKPFASQSEMFNYAAGCKLFWIREKDAEEEEDMVGDLAFEGQEGGEAGKKKLKHKDRQRMLKRPIFNDWINVFVPKCREEGLYTEQKITRDEIRDEVFKQFGVQKEYEEKLASWKLLRHKDELWREVIKGSIPLEDIDPQLRAASIRTIKAVIMEGEEFQGVVPAAAKPDEHGFYDVAAVKAFVEANWQEAGRVGLERQMVRARLAMEEKEAKRKRGTEKAEVAGD
ncbi:hypothetical protein LOCC1_G004212 [Lachnellula occidentalis]|uniref:Uncharacterized protein n=1 Tax=Lachnellula occidentalis TaxID=215460 RepID=A0A8H8UJB3_9HELO|nr:hypothetical protein LOCC1_G004212 [Lachnellula occidentalis]